ncbi:MAG: Ldh family oxidoreductase [Planctomycetota bacterium]
MPETYFVVPADIHNKLVLKAYMHRGYDRKESQDAVRLAESASSHGIRTHNAIKALHLDLLFGSKTGGCVPKAEIEEIPSKYKAVKIWNANRKLGQATAYRAMTKCMKLADRYGVGMVVVDNAFHYLWGGGYVIDAANKGYLAWTGCTSTLAEVVPFMGKKPTMGTDPHSWGFPTTEAVGFPIVMDFATSTIAMGRIQQFRREKKPLPPGAAVDADGNPTTDAEKAVSLLPFGGHKGYGLGLVDELYAAFTGGSLPTIRGIYKADDEKHTTNFFFQIVRPDALSCGKFGKGRSQAENVKMVLQDILGHGNDACKLPGQPEAEAMALTKKHGGLLFTSAEMDAFNEISAECGARAWNKAKFPQITI